LHTHGARARAQPSLFGAGVGLCGVTITQTALVLALQYVPAFNASLMQPSQPVLTLLLALCLRLEALRLRSVAGALKLAGILIGCAGAVNGPEAPSAQCQS
jgi:drug/metabolite transporter (DMT)-like permease